MEVHESVVRGPVNRGVARDPASPVLSFVIPAFNEEQLIGRTIGAIHRLVPPLSYEIIVVDNGSADATGRVASDLGATLIIQEGGTIGSLRNRGAASASGGILVFLDADVVITPEWISRIPVLIEMLTEDPRRLTGAMCTIPDDASWIERCWFAPMRAPTTHVGSGHMILTRTFFDELGGFDESISTGEDYDISQRAIARGAQLDRDRRLKTVHLGYPRNIRAFVQRESWHGVGDFRSLSAFVRSKVAMAAATFAVLHVVLVFAVLAGAVWLGSAAALAIASLCLLSSSRQYRSKPIRLILINAGVFWIYFWARSLALVRRATGTGSRGSR
jgi:glycosyltransferase involved in cell wall biosynthesis